LLITQHKKKVLPISSASAKKRGRMSRFGVVRDREEDGTFNPIGMIETFKELKTGKFIGLIKIKILLPILVLGFYICTAMIPEIARLLGSTVGWWSKVSCMGAVIGGLAYQTRQLLLPDRSLYQKSSDIGFSYGLQAVYCTVQTLFHFWILEHSIVGTGTVSDNHLTNILALIHWTIWGMYRLQSSRRNRIIEDDTLIYWLAYLACFTEAHLVLSNIRIFPWLFNVSVLSKAIHHATYITGILLALWNSEIGHTGILSAVAIIHLTIQCDISGNTTHTIPRWIKDCLLSLNEDDKTKLLPSGMLVAVALTALCKDIKFTLLVSDAFNTEEEAAASVAAAPRLRATRGVRPMSREEIRKATEAAAAVLEAAKGGKWFPPIVNSVILISSLAFYYSQHNGWYFALLGGLAFSLILDANAYLSTSNSTIAKMTREARRHVGI
jgi:hypothetical protein